MKVSGPFIEYDCHKCGTLVSQKVRPETLKSRMDEVREKNETAVCAACAIKQVTSCDIADIEDEFNLTKTD